MSVCAGNPISSTMIIQHRFFVLAVPFTIARREDREREHEIWGAIVDFLGCILRLHRSSTSMQIWGSGQFHPTTTESPSHKTPTLLIFIISAIFAQQFDLKLQFIRL